MYRLYRIRLTFEEKTAKVFLIIPARHHGSTLTRRPYYAQSVFVNQLMVNGNSAGLEKHEIK
jgi:hypothetical protein